MVYVLGTIQFLLIGYLFFYELKNKSAATFLWATLLVMFGVMHFIVSFTGDVEYSNRVLWEASAFAIVFCLIYLIVRMLLGINLKKASAEKMTYSEVQRGVNGTKNLGMLFVIFIVVLVVKLSSYIRSAGGVLNTSWSAGRAYSSDLSYFNSVQVINVLFFALAGIIVIFWIKKKYLFALISLAGIVVDVIITRNRVEILPLLGAVVAIYLLYMKKIKFQTIIFIVIAAAIVIFVIYGLRVIRWYGTLQNLLNTFTWSGFLTQLNVFFSDNSGELGLRRYFYYFLSRNNEFSGFGEGATYLRMLLVFIPTQWSFGLKPDDFAQTMGSAVGMGAGGSMHPTLFGDCYANMGIFGVFLGGLWAILASVGDKIMFSIKKTSTSLLLFVLWSSEFCVIGRGAVYNGFAMIAYGTLILLVADFVITRIHIPQIKFTITRKKA